MDDLTLRDAVPADAEAITRFHVRLWRDTYRAIAPDAAMALLDEARRLPAWQAALKAPPPQGAVIALAGAGIVGLVSFGAPSHPVFAGRGEVTHLYVDQAMRGRGLGARLLALALGGLHAAGYAGAALAVVTQNPGARAFYRAQGGEEIASFQDPGLLWPSDDILVAWDLRG